MGTALPSDVVYVVENWGMRMGSEYGRMRTIIVSYGEFSPYFLLTITATSDRRSGIIVDHIFVGICRYHLM